MVKKEYSIKITGDKNENRSYPSLYFSSDLDLFARKIRKIGGTKRTRFNRCSNRHEEKYTLRLNGRFIEAEIYSIELSDDSKKPTRINFDCKTKKSVERTLELFKKNIELNGKVKS